MPLALHRSAAGKTIADAGVRSIFPQMRFPGQWLWRSQFLTGAKDSGGARQTQTIDGEDSVDSIYQASKKARLEPSNTLLDERQPSASCFVAIVKTARVKCLVTFLRGIKQTYIGELEYRNRPRGCTV